MSDDFPSLPSFDARDFEPPAWAKQTYKRTTRPDSANNSEDERESLGGDGDDPSFSPQSMRAAGVELQEPDTIRFTIAELKVCGIGLQGADRFRTCLSGACLSRTLVTSTSHPRHSG